MMLIADLFLEGSIINYLRKLYLHISKTVIMLYIQLDTVKIVQPEIDRKSICNNFLFLA